MRKQIIKNLTANYLGNGTAIFLGFITVPIVLRSMGKVSFGVISLAEALFAIIQLFLFSLRIAVARFSTHAFSKGQEAEFTACLGTGRLMLLTLTLIVGVFSIPFVLFLPACMNIPATMIFSFRTLLVLLCFSFVLTIPNAIYWVILYAHQRMDLVNTAYYGGLVLRGLLIFLLFGLLPKHLLGLELYGAIYLMTTLFQNGLVYFWQKKMFNQKIPFPKADWQRVKSMLSFSGFSILGNIGSVLVDSGMKVMVNLLWGPMANAFYTVAEKIPNMLKRIFVEPTGSLTPSFTSFMAQDAISKARELFMFYTKGLVVILLPLGISFILYSKKAIHLWVGTGFDVSTDLLPCLLTGALLSVPLAVCSSFLTAAGNVKLPAFVNNIYALGVFVLGILFGVILHMNLRGVVWGALISQILGPAFFLPRRVSKILMFPLRLYWWNIFLKPFLVASVPIFIPFLFMGRFYPSSIEFQWAILAFIGVAGSYCLAYRLNFSKDEREGIRKMGSAFFLNLQAHLNAFRTKEIHA